MSARINLTKLTAHLAFLARECRTEAAHHEGDHRAALLHTALQLGYCIRTARTDPEQAHAFGVAAIDLIARAATSRAFIKEEL